VSGIGNIYADEALWAARVHYEQPTATLSRRRAQALLAAALASPAAAAAYADAKASYDAGRFDQAASEFEALLAARPDDAAMHYDLGNAYLKAGRLGRASASYQRAFDLDPRDLPVVADPHLSESQLLQEPFRFVETPENIGLDPGAVRNAGGKAGERRLIPGRESHPTRYFADIFLGKAGFAQRAPDPELRGGAFARPVVVQIVDVCAVGHPVDAVFPADLDKPAEQLSLAEETSVGGVGREVFVFELVGLYADHVDAQFGGCFQGILFFP